MLLADFRLVQRLTSKLNPRVKEVTTTEDYKLKIVFDNGEQCLFNCSDLLDFGVFSEFKDKQYQDFARL